MSLTLPVTATCRMIGHAWVAGPDPVDPTRTVSACSRCDALDDEPRPKLTAAAYQPRHLRQRD